MVLTSKVNNPNKLRIALLLFVQYMNSKSLLLRKRIKRTSDVPCRSFPSGVCLFEVLEVYLNELKVGASFNLGLRYPHIWCEQGVFKIGISARDSQI